MEMTSVNSVLRLVLYVYRDTLYTPEELMAMVLEAAKETASNFAGTY